MPEADWELGADGGPIARALPTSLHMQELMFHQLLDA